MSYETRACHFFFFFSPPVVVTQGIAKNTLWERAEKVGCVLVLDLGVSVGCFSPFIASTRWLCRRRVEGRRERILWAICCLTEVAPVLSDTRKYDTSACYTTTATLALSDPLPGDSSRLFSPSPPLPFARPPARPTDRPTDRLFSLDDVLALCLAPLVIFPQHI